MDILGAISKVELKMAGSAGFSHNGECLALDIIIRNLLSMSVSFPSQ